MTCAKCGGSMHLEEKDTFPDKFKANRFIIVVE